MLTERLRNLLLTRCRLSCILLQEEETMSDNKNKGDKVRPTVHWTAEDRTRHQAIRDMFRNWHPSPEELVASGEGANFDLHGEYRELRPFVEEIKRAREAAGLTLAKVSRRSRTDQPALSLLENGRNKKPTLDTLWRYVAAVGRRLVLTTEAIRYLLVAGPFDVLCHLGLRNLDKDRSTAKLHPRPSFPVRIQFLSVASAARRHNSATRPGCEGALGSQKPTSRTSSTCRVL
jgi:transcriptional regulator with XRE-family HTH domain